jgi:hypothetical protein
MNHLHKLALSSLFLAGSLHSDGVGLEIGPFNLNIGIDDDEDGRLAPNRPFLGNPICQAIAVQSRVTLILEAKEVTNSREMHVLTKRVIIEPYAFGFSGNGTPLLKGNVIEEKTVEEVTIKVDEDRFRAVNQDNQKKKGLFADWFKSETTGINTLDLSNIKNIQIVPNSHFEVPKDYKGFKDDEDVRLICELRH